MEIEESLNFDDKYEITLISVESLIPNLLKKKIKIRDLEEKEEERVVVHL
jgi:hypothetical protein